MTTVKKVRCPKCKTQMNVPTRGVMTIACSGCKATLKIGNATSPVPPARPDPTSLDKQTIQCSKCGKSLRLPAIKQGKKFRCPGCRTRLSTPSLDRSASKPLKSATITRTQTAMQQTSTSNPFDLDSLPATTPTNRSQSSFDSTYQSTTHLSSHAKTGVNSGKSKSRRMKPKSRKMSQAWKRFTILGTIAFVLSAIPLLGLLLGAIISGISGLIMFGGYFWTISLVFGVDSVAGFRCLLFPVFMGRFIRDDWPRYRKPATLTFTALGCGFAAFAASAAQIFLLDVFLRK